MRKSFKEWKADWLARLAKKHGIFVFQQGGTIDFMCMKTGKSLGIWTRKHQPHFIINGVSHNGTPKEALAIVAPYDL